MATHQLEAQVEPRDAWLKRLERGIDLPSYLGQRGYEVQRATADGIRMTNPASGDAVMVKSSGREGWTFANPNDPKDRGTISDFIMRRDHASLAQVAERIVVLADPHSRDAEAARYRDQLHGSDSINHAKGDHQRSMEIEKGVVGALDRIGISKGTLDEWRFGRINSPEALERAMSDPKDLWASKYRPTDRHLVFAEQPVDAMAFEKIRGRQISCYLATGRQLTDEMKTKIAHVLCEVPTGVTVVLAFGRDERGQQLAEQVRALAPTLRMDRQAPDVGSRWSTQMQLEQRHVRSLARSMPALERR